MRAHTAPPRRRLALAVQRLAASSTLPRRRVNFLILGSDNDSKFASYAAPLTQVMIVLSIDPVSHAVTLLSIPRDFWVHIPGYRYNVGPDGTVGWGKIDAASMLGFASAACTVERNFGIPIDHWVWVGLKGFIRVVDSMGGVTLDVTHPVIDDTYPDDLANPNDPYAYRRIYIPPGPQHLGGDAALRFVRSRHGDVQGDFGRSQRQQIVISQLRRLLMSQDGAALVALAPALLKDFQGEIKTDIASPDLATAAYYWSLLRSVGHPRISQVVLSPPYSTPEYWVTDTDPQVEAGNGGQPLQEDAVLPNWPLINQKIKSLFGAQYVNDPQHFCT
jgi:LCP family protein required for cell wall assembly